MLQSCAQGLQLDPFLVRLLESREAAAQRHLPKDGTWQFTRGLWKPQIHLECTGLYASKHVRADSPLVPLDAA